MPHFGSPFLDLRLQIENHSNSDLEMRWQPRERAWSRQSKNYPVIPAR